VPRRDLCSCPSSRYGKRGRGPRGIRTPDLMAASQNVLDGVLTSEYAGHGRAEWSLLSAVSVGLITLRSRSE
jgi:hypothetical protein